MRKWRKVLGLRRRKKEKRERGGWPCVETRGEGESERKMRAFWVLGSGLKGAYGPDPVRVIVIVGWVWVRS